MRLHTHWMIWIATKDKLNSGTVKIFSLNYFFGVVITNVNGVVLTSYQRVYKQLCSKQGIEWQLKLWALLLWQDELGQWCTAVTHAKRQALCSHPMLTPKSKPIYLNYRQEKGWLGWVLNSFYIPNAFCGFVSVNDAKFFPRKRWLLSVLFILRNKSFFVSTDFCSTVVMKFIPLTSLQVCIRGAGKGKWEKEEIGYHFLSLFWSFLSLLQMCKENLLKWWDILLHISSQKLLVAIYNTPNPQTF